LIAFDRDSSAGSLSFSPPPPFAFVVLPSPFYHSILFITHPAFLPHTPVSSMEQPPVQIGQFILGKNLGIGAFGKVR
jgi:hypothetical protein